MDKDLIKSFIQWLKNSFPGKNILSILLVKILHSFIVLFLFGKLI